MPTTRVSAMDQLASPGGTTRDLGINWLNKLKARALAMQQGQEGILASQAQRAQLGGLQSYRQGLLDLDQKRLTQTGALGIGGLDLTREANRALATDRAAGRTLENDKFNFTKGADARALAAKRGELELGREFESPLAKLLRQAFSLEGIAPTSGGAGGQGVAPGAAAPAPVAPRRPQGTGAFFASGAGGTVDIPAPAAVSPERPGDARFGPDTGIGGTPFEREPGAFDVPTLEDLVAQDEAQKMGTLATGARGPSSPLDNLDFGSVRGQLIGQALGIDPTRLPGSRESVVRGRTEAREDIGAQQETVVNALDTLLAKGLPRSEGIIGGEEAGLLSRGARALGVTDFTSLSEAQAGFAPQIEEVARQLEAQGVPRDIILRTIAQWARERELPEPIIRAIEDALRRIGGA